MPAVLVRWASVDELEPDDEGLGPRERGRMEQYRERADRQRFVGVRRLLRFVVAAHAGCAPEEVELVQTCRRCGGPHGRPVVLVRGGRGPEVSMAHAGALAMVAIAEAPVGVDVEPGPTGDGLQTWVRREAVLKATGLGLEVDPELLRLSAPGHPPKLLAWDGPGSRPALRLVDLEPTAGYVAAVARLGRRRLRLDTEAVILPRG